MKQRLISLALVMGLIAVLTGCATTATTPDNIAKIPYNSPLSKVKVGMSIKQVTDMIGNPTEQKVSATWKAFIPFGDIFMNGITEAYYYYKNNGIVVFEKTAGVHSTMHVKIVIYNPNETGYAKKKNNI
ncbi:MAG TPA: hypothetical protein QF753_07145 [Victivallales bacterium]|nr:hypothetical protein [Victivallales bacterium]